MKIKNNTVRAEEDSARQAKGMPLDDGRLDHIAGGARMPRRIIEPRQRRSE